MFDVRWVKLHPFPRNQQEVAWKVGWWFRAKTNPLQAVMFWPISTWWVAIWKVLFSSHRVFWESKLFLSEFSAWKFFACSGLGCFLLGPCGHAWGEFFLLYDLAQRSQLEQSILHTVHTSDKSWKFLVAFGKKKEWSRQPFGFYLFSVYHEIPSKRKVPCTESGPREPQEDSHSLESQLLGKRVASVWCASKSMNLEFFVF